MSNVKKSITDSEYAIMKILWKSEKQMTVSEVIKELDKNDWTASTVTMLKIDYRKKFICKLAVSSLDRSNAFNACTCI